ncbi:unnamed protein product [Phytophthora lilii]|uniref:Unnamed protein product n=1 Tax=Phytophthora lilii TaxID=2077276 RepID=A0A9W6UBL5_9STRA|nr:unnamed protein product [Phytophthora lilii]
MVFSVMGFAGITTFNGMVSVAAEERAVFYRELASQTYNAFWYFFASTTVMEVPYTLVSVLLCMVAFYPVVGFTGVAAFFTFYLILTIYVLFQVYLAEFVVFLTLNIEVAEILGMVVNLITYLLAGYSPPASSLPAGVKRVYYINPLTYTLSALSTIVFGDCPGDGGSSSSSIGCNQVMNAPPSFPDEITYIGATTNNEKYNYFSLLVVAPRKQERGTLKTPSISGLRLTTRSSCTSRC